MNNGVSYLVLGMRGGTPFSVELKGGRDAALARAREHAKRNELAINPDLTPRTGRHVDILAGRQAARNHIRVVERRYRDGILVSTDDILVA